MDFNDLYDFSISILEQKYKSSWTDFNSHDPGITILEAVCYALTDLTYRLDFPLQDLLTSSSSASQPLFSLAQILPTSPVTLADWRKLAIDVSGVRNAWVEPITVQYIPLVHDSLNNTLSTQGVANGGEAVQLKGLYRVLLDTTDDTVETTDDTVESVRNRLHAHRPLGEDFVEIVRLKSQPVAIQATVEISAVNDGEAVMLTILKRLANHISPSVPFVTLRQLLDEGIPIDEIYTGPRLTHGFIDDEQLQKSQRRKELRASDLIQVMMDVPAVKAVRKVYMQTDTLRNRTWTLPLKDTEVARLKSPISVLPELSEGDSPPFETIISLTRNGLPVQVNLDNVKRAFDTWWQENRQRHPDADEALMQPKGRNRNVAAYTSIMHHLPENYGVGELGLPASATPERIAKAKQLKAYLLLFDQLLANAHAQLAHLGDLFSASPATSHTYFSQPIAEPALNLEEIMPLSAEELQNLATVDGDRQHRFLNHLLARFGESLTDYALVVNKDSATAQDISNKIIADKQAFLLNYPDHSRMRGTGANYLEPRSPQNRSGLERRLQYKLGLEESEDEEFFLIEHILLRPIDEDSEQTVPLLAGNIEAPLIADPYSLQLSFVFPEGKGRFSEEIFKRFVERTIREETPAHLTTNIHWLPENKFTEFKNAYGNWLKKRRLYWTKPS